MLSVDVKVHKNSAWEFCLLEFPEEIQTFMSFFFTSVDSQEP